MKKIFVSAALASLLFGAFPSLSAADIKANYNIIPKPREVVIKNGASFTLNAKTVITYPKGNEALKRNAELLAGYIKDLTGFELKITTKAPKKNFIMLHADANGGDPTQNLTIVGIQQAFVDINGNSPESNFNAIQTFRKSIPDVTGGKEVEFAPVTITDSPRFTYRGAHLDVSRHFYPTDSIKTFIDMLALHNINKFHWHLTDDQGWRLELKKYPRLTEVGSVRNGTCIGHDFSTNDGKPYGGFYTQDEVKDIIKYAADRHIDVIPEIDLPGHMLAALKAYPELGCTGGPYEIWTRWGVADDVLCAGNDKTLEFIDGVLDEVAELFPSEYIHVGGDECPKVRWEECEKCQARIKELGLKDDDHSKAEQKLQTYIMTHASNTLARHGKKMIGWDEILEGGLTPGAIVMSWRGEEGGRDAARQHHEAIMTPTNYCYFDYYQTKHRDGEPDAIGGYVPVEKVYSFDPVPSSLTPEEAKYIIGAQANLWTEYIPTFSQVQYMELPRLAALCEVQWTDPSQKEYSDFVRRVPQLIKHYKALGYNYANHVFDVTGTLSPDVEKGVITATFETADDAPIHYTLDGTEPTATSPLYTGPLAINHTAVVKAAAFREDGHSRVFTDSVTFNKATTAKVTLVNEPHSRYKGMGGLSLVDGRFGPDAFNTGEWLGFVGAPLVAVIDMGKEKEFSSLSIRNLVDTPNWIFDARNIKVEVSDNGTDFTEVASQDIPQITKHIGEIIPHKLTFNPVKARYVRLTEECENSIPEFHGAGIGKPAFIFVDEIVID